MWVAKRLDMPWRLLAYGLARTTAPSDPLAAQRRLERAWLPSDRALAALSVRSGLDLFLTAARFPPGSEVLMSAITLDDMRRIVVAHGLRPIPLDLDFHHLSPDLDEARRRLTPRTRAIVIAHLFGGRVGLDPWAEFCQRHGLALIEDCAQAYDGRAFTGHEGAGVSLFSFGPIKTATALGGAMLHVRDTELLARMRAIQAVWPRQATREYRARLLKYAALKVASSRYMYGSVRHMRRGQGASPALRNFPGVDLLAEIRRQPCAALLKTLAHGLETFDASALAARSATAARLRALLGDAIPSPGAAARPHNHWVFPICAADPRRLIDDLASQGFDAIHAASMQAIPAPPDAPDMAPREAMSLARQLIYLPCYPSLPERELVRLAHAVMSSLANRATCRETASPPFSPALPTSGMA